MLMNRDKVVLVDENDFPLGEMEKLEAHLKGALHRAFSVFVFNPNGEMLIHQRAAGKYHGAGLWTNACCSHPQWGEDVRESARERLQYEMGLDCELEKRFSFHYHTPVENNLIEHEFDHVFRAITDQQPDPHPKEVQDFRWMPMDVLLEDIKTFPQRYTFWFKKALLDWKAMDASFSGQVVKAV